VTFGCIAEPTLHKDLPQMVKLVKNHKVPFVSVVSNGQLLTVPSLMELAENGLDELIISIHGVTCATYERFMVGASYSELHNLLNNITELRRSGKFKQCKVRLNYVVNSENVSELKFFFQVFGSYYFDILQLRPLIEGSFQDKLKLSELPKYDDILNAITMECKQRNIMLLSQGQRIPEHRRGYQALLMPAIFRYISPGLVWKKEFNWQQESYVGFCRRYHFTRSLIHSILSKPEELQQRMDPEYKNSLNYSIT
jgi:MoaA/NifB/PqqE/SkfB family radical SAM enzyme